MAVIGSSILHRLKEIDFMRPIVIALLVMMHSFSIYSGGGSWEYPQGINGVSAYRWIQIIAYGCLLEAFTFISGYLFCFQLKYKNPDFLSLTVSKLRRLILPSIVFSTLYVGLFQVDWDGTSNWMNYLYVILSGAGHLWYLPMLFWCFIITWILFRIRISEELKLFFLFLFSIVSVIPIPLRFNTVFHYLPFFYLGTYLYNHKVIITTPKSIVILFVFLISLISVTVYREMNPAFTPLEKAILWYIKQFYASLGTIGVFSVCKIISEKKTPSERLIKLNSFCFGIYIFHQFVLELLYYHSALPHFCGSYLLPWCGWLLALFLSLGVTIALQKTRVGKCLLG